MAPMLAKLLAHAIAWPLALLPLALQSALGALVGTLLRLALPRRREVVRANLAVAFPERDVAGREELLRAHFRHLGHLVVDTLQQPALAFPPLRRRKIRPVGWEHLERAVARGPSAILLCAHLGSWEAGAAVATLPGVRLLSVYKKARGFAEDFVRELRGAFPQVLVPKHEAKRPLIRGAKEGAVLGLIADQGGHERFPFFGRETFFPDGPGHFVARHGSVPVPCFSIRAPGGYYECHCLPPPEFPAEVLADREACRRAVTGWYIALLEDWVRRYPAQYYWVHDMWRIFKDD